MPTVRLDDPDPAVLDGRHIRASAFESAQRELIRTLRSPTVAAGTQPSRALTIGAGYARLPRLLVEAGYQVTAIDPSFDATEAARRQSRSGPASDVDYRVGQPDDLAGLDRTFDVVWCIDTLELRPDPHTVLAAVARLTEPGGTIVLDTLNDTVLSRLIYLGLFQRFPPTKIMPPGRYRRAGLITPSELSHVCEQAGIAIERIVGYEPASPIALMRALLGRRRGRVSDSELGGLARFRLSNPSHTPPVTYYAIANPPRG